MKSSTLLTTQESKSSRILRSENKEELVCEEDLVKPTNYWRKHKKPTVDYLHDSIFTSDRQLEDQRRLIERNRNPQLYEPTRVDKVRSQVIAAPIGRTRAVAMKANVLNKIVREASGIHNYTIVAPPRMASQEESSKEEDLDPETNPYVRAYAKESKIKPVLVSYGHRPRSASRTFHPATMRIRLRRGEILPSTSAEHKPVGLPVAVLAKVLAAPKIENPLEAKMRTEDEARERAKSPSMSVTAAGELNDLFFTKEQQRELFADLNKTNSSDFFGKEMRVSKSEGGFADASLAQSSNTNTWISSNSKRKKKKPRELEPLINDDRPPWDEEFHRINVKNSEIYKLKSSGFNPIKDIPLGELLRRFTKKTFSENEEHPFCTEKQRLDKIERAGLPVDVPKSVPLKGQALYYDPWDEHVKLINKQREEAERERNERKTRRNYSIKMLSVPEVPYFPTSKLKEIREKSPEGELREAESSKTTASKASKTIERLDEEQPDWENLEEEWTRSIKAAKRGNPEILHEQIIGKYMPTGSSKYGSGKSFRPMSNTLPDTANSLLSEDGRVSDERLSAIYADSFFGDDYLQRRDFEGDQEPYGDVYVNDASDENGQNDEGNRADRLFMMAQSDQDEEELYGEEGGGKF